VKENARKGSVKAQAVSALAAARQGIARNRGMKTGMFVVIALRRKKKKKKTPAAKSAKTAWRGGSLAFRPVSEGRKAGRAAAHGACSIFLC